MATCSKIDSRGLTAQSFLRDYIDARTPLPALVSLPDALAVDSSEILKTMRTEAGERFVEVELGRYNEADFSQVSMRLAQYLDWLETAEDATVGGQQLYLAQTRLFDLVPALRTLLPPPSFLADHLADRTLDLYQTSCFLGPAGAVTPLHRDPYENLFTCSSAACPAARKRFILVPPDSIDPALRGGPTGNTPRIADEDVRSLPGALSCDVRLGEALWVPRGWYHRVENVLVGEKSGPSWLLGTGWWFLRRSR